MFKFVTSLFLRLGDKESNGLVTDTVYCLVKIIEKDKWIIAAVQFEIKLFAFFYQSKQLTDYIRTDIYCKLSKCIGQTPRSYEHYLVLRRKLKFLAKYRYASIHNLICYACQTFANVDLVALKC